EVLSGVVGSTIKITPQPKLGFYTEQEAYEGVVKADGSLVIEIVYEEFTATFTYNLVLNGGNMFYPNREAMVLDWLADYNLFGGTSYTLTTIPTDTFGTSSTNMHTFFYDARFRDNWLWVAKYLSVVGSSTNIQASANN